MTSNRTINVVGSIHSHRLLTQMPPKLKWATASGELTDKNVAKTGPILDLRLGNKKNWLRPKL